MSEGAETTAGDDLVVDPQMGLRMALAAHRLGKVEDAEEMYGLLIDAVPDYAEAHNLRGVLRNQEGRLAEAIEDHLRAVDLRPDHPGMRNNLANALAKGKRYEEAVAVYEVALGLSPRYADALSNRGAALAALGRSDEAEDSYRRAIAADPDHREAHDNLGRLLSLTGRIDDAIACHEQALRLEPRSGETRRFLISAYCNQGQYAKAQAVIEEWLVQVPDSPSAKYLLAAVSGENVPDRASDEYVEGLFDRFAAVFDDKLAQLGYRAPELVTERVATLCGPPAGDRVILDAGCGTGLCGPLLKPFAARLLGVDLSANMLDEARRRGAFDALTQGELTRHLQDHPGAFDLIVSADTLCYFGALDEVLAAAAAALKPGGALVFTVEHDPDDASGFRLNRNGRYIHGIRYVAEKLAGAGLVDPVIREDVLRQEYAAPVAGLVVSARRGAPASSPG